MKKLTSSELTYLMQNAGDIDYTFDFTDKQLSSYERHDGTEYDVIDAEGVVKYTSVSEGIEVVFYFFATTKMFCYDARYDLDIAIDTDSFKTNGFVLVDEDGLELGRAITSVILENEFSEREWVDGVRNQARGLF